MNLDLLQIAINTIKSQLETAITSSSYGGQQHPSGLRAKEALIKSQNLILNLHEVGKQNNNEELLARELNFNIFPEIGQSCAESTHPDKFLRLGQGRRLRSPTEQTWYDSIQYH